MALTPEEIAQAEAIEKGASELNPLRDFSAEDLSALAVQDKSFVIADEFARQKDLHSDPAITQKVADALNIVKQRGFKLEDLPSVPEASKAVGTAIKGLAGQIWNYANAAGNVAAGAVSELVGAEGLAQGYAENINQRLASNIAGTEEAVTGLSQLAGKAVNKAGRTAGVTKAFSDYTPAEKVTDLFNEAGKSEVRESRLAGKGEFTKAVTGEEQQLDPEEVATLAAGDPLSFYLFGAGAGAIGKAAKAVTPAAVGNIARSIGKATENVLPVVSGKTLTAASITAKGAAKVVEKTAPVVLPVVGAVKGAALGAQFGGVTGGAIGGLAAGRAAGKVIAGGARAAARVADNIADVGRQVSGSIPIKSAYTQAGRDILQALPGAAGEVAKGTVLDIGLAAATAEVPQDTAGAVGFGTAIGALAGAGRVGRRVLSGQLIGPRDYGINTVIPSSGQFPGFDSMHADAVKTATPGVKARLNAIRQFAETAAPGTDIFHARDSAAVENALLSQGLSPETARIWAAQEGVFTTDLVGRDGQPKKVIIVRNVDAAPHEAQHAIQDVLGEEANQKIDAIVRETYDATWESEGQNYANRLTETGDPRSWREVVLDETGIGLAEAKEKIYRDIFNRVEAESGSAPAPKLVEEMTKAEVGRLLDAAVVRHPNADPNEVGRHVWRDVFQDNPEQITTISDRYLARELAAENFDALFKSQGPRLSEGTQLPERLARIVGGVVSALGGEPLAGRVSELGGVTLRTPVIEAVRGSVVSPEVSRPPATTTPRSRLAPGTSDAITAAAEEARALAEEAPTTIQAGGTKSPRELLGEIAEAIASQSGVKINYLSAPGEPAAATTSNRTTRRAIIETFRTMPAAARALWEKTFFPDKVIKTKQGKYQVQGWAPEVFAANAHKLAEFLIENPDAQILSPYAVDATTKSFTPAAWQQLYQDTQTFVQNQMRGSTGAGEPLVVPRSVTDAGGYAPPTRTGAIALEQSKADFINLLFNFKLPETPRIQSGKRPLNIVGQEVSVATKPGRVEVPARPRGEFVGEEAARQGIEGRSILEVNPLRNQLESIGKPMPSFLEAIQKLNLENIVDLQGAPEQPQFRGNTLTLTAGFQAATARGRATEELGFEIRHTGGPANPGISIFKDGTPVGDISAVRKSPVEADIDSIKVNKEFRGQGLSEILYREIGKRLQDEGVENVTGMIVNPRALTSRTKVFPETRIENEIQSRGGFDTAFEVRSKISPEARFSPAELADRVEKFTPSEFRDWAAAIKSGFTQEAWKVGLGAPDRSFAESLKQRYDTLSPKVTEAMKAKQFDDAMALASQAQFFREAYEAATGTASAGDYLRKLDPDFKAPFPPEEAAKFAPPDATVTGRTTKKGGSAVIPVMPQSEVEKIADAIYIAEGGAKASKPYGILSVKVKDEAEARRVAINTIKNNWKRWHDAGRPGDYLEFLAKRYAPVGAKNDPRGLNKNWLKNVRSHLNK